MILTFHDNINYGAVAQAYCLSKFLDIPIVDFNYPHRREGMESRVKHRPCLEWSRKNLNRSQRFDSEEEAVEFCNSLPAVVIGSDEVWKYRNNHIFDPRFPSIYYGKGITTKKIAYAVSSHDAVFGLEQIKLIDQFDLISVRDHHTLNKIKSASPELARRVYLVPDPTFAVDFFEPQPKTRETAYVEDVEAEGPIKWFEMVSSCKSATTNRFHGLCAGILGNTPIQIGDSARPKTLELFAEIEAHGWDDLAGFIQQRRKINEDFRELVKPFFA